MRRVAIKESVAIAAGLLGAVIVVACSTPSDNNGDGQNPVTSASNTAAATTGGGNTAASNSVAASNTSGANTSASGTGSSTAAASATGPVSTCTAYADKTDKATVTPMFPAVLAAYPYGDPAGTFICVDFSATKACFNGKTVNAGSDYANWGAGVGFDLKESATKAWDAKALGITHFQVEFAGVEGGAPLRVQISQIDDPAVTDAAKNYSTNGFITGSVTSPKDVKASGPQTYDLAKFILPDWTKVEKKDDTGAAVAAKGQVLDTSKLGALQFQVAASDKSEGGPYNICISSLKWGTADASGTFTEVTVPARTAAPAESGTATATGTSTAPATSGSSTAPATSGSSTAPATTGSTTASGTGPASTTGSSTAPVGSTTASSTASHSATGSASGTGAASATGSASASASVTASATASN